MLPAMTEPINFNKARKALARAQAKAQAAANRARHGRTKGQKEAEDLSAERMARLLDQARRED
jgi:hypothetical protein